MARAYPGPRGFSWNCSSRKRESEPRSGENESQRTTSRGQGSAREKTRETQRQVISLVCQYCAKNHRTTYCKNGFRKRSRMKRVPASSTGLKKVDYTPLFRLQIGSNREVGRSGTGIFTMQYTFTNKNTIIFTGRFSVITNCQFIYLHTNNWKRNKKQN